MKNEQGHCADCKIPDRICTSRQGGHHPVNCSTLLYKEALAKAATEYEKPEIAEFARQASLQEGSSYIQKDADPFYLFPIKSRLQDTMEFARRMQYERLGLAFCGGLHKEAELLAQILQDHGFEVVSAMCKVGGVGKEELGIKKSDQVCPKRFESMCNPVAQAEILNAAQTQFNLLLGLCVGHDSLFLKYTQAFTTVFAVKDRVLAHNPLGALYNYHSYYMRLKAPLTLEEEK